MNAICKTSSKTRLMACLMLFVMVFSFIAGVTGSALSPSIANADSAFDAIDISGGSVTVKGTEAGNASTMDGIMNRYKNIATFVLGIMTITMILFMIIQFTKLGAAGDNDAARKKAIMGILTTGIAAALLGSSAIWFGFFYNAINTVSSN